MATSTTKRLTIHLPRLKHYNKVPEATIIETLADRVLSVAKSQVGVSEVPKGSNGGPQVSQYLKAVALLPGNAWCMAFVYWCVKNACLQLGITTNPLIRTGRVMFQWENTKLRKLPGRASGVKPGDIFIMSFKGGTGHTGFVTKIENGIAYTIEGNTNDDGSREGYEVAERKRPVSSILGFIQLP
jgi:hypothetical protein